MHTGFRLMPPSQNLSDEELMRQLTAGSQEALRPLYSRYGRLIFHLAARTLDRAAVEEIVQDVFLTVWRQAATFDPARGPLRPWILRIARFRILNELRRQNRQPQLALESDDLRLVDLPDDSPEPVEAFWREYRRAVLQSAFAALSPLQRQALGLAFFEDLTHEQVAAVLHLPLGTAKTRIRDGLQKLRGKLAPLAAALTVVILVLLGVRYQAERVARQRDERALALVTASDTGNIRLAPVPRVPQETHGRYRNRPGAEIAVLTFSHFPPAPAGRTYQAWVLYNGTWISLGTALPDATGSARLIAEGPELAVPPEAVQVTLEPADGSSTPSGPVVVAWPQG